MKHLFVLLFTAVNATAFAQQDSVRKEQPFTRTNPAPDTLTNQDAIYDRPFITLGKTRTAVGGYVEGNTNYFAEDGVSEGFSMELRRFNVFLYSSIHSRIKFLSELEFEHGTEEIALETAVLDFQLHNALNFRAGILLPQIGLVNANHDSPKWEFIERPLSSTEIIPTTLSEVGFGLYGKFYAGNNILSYDAYLVNGLQDGVILNSMGKTHLASGQDPEMFGEDNNGSPMYNARLALANRKIGEFGFSYYGGAYNSFRHEGVMVDAKRNLSLVAFDFSTQIKKLKIQGELAGVDIEIPASVSEVYGERQYGGFIDLIYPVMNRRVLKFDNAVLNTSVRLERIDYNVGTFTITDSNIGDEVSAIAVGIGLRPVPGTILRFNYRYHWIQDNLGNPTIRLGGFQVGVASYF